MEIDGNSIIYAGAGAGLGIYWFFKGFKELKAKRIIQNIPTSKIKTGAVGTNVEIKGRIIAEKDKLVTAPLSGLPCVLYSLVIEKEVRRKNHRRWVKVDQFFSDKGFFVDDQSGANALVFVDKAEISRKGGKQKLKMASRDFDQMPSRLYEALSLNEKKLKKFKFKDRSWWNSARYRFVEWCFKPGEEIYVLGYASSGHQAIKKRKAKFKTFVEAKKMIQEDEKLQTTYDSDGDGHLSPEELEMGARIVAEKLEETYSPEKVDRLLPKTKLIFKFAEGHPFHISNIPEEDLVKSMGFASALKIWGGPALTIGCSIYLWNTYLSFQ